MAPAYADHPFTFIPDPRPALKEGDKHDDYAVIAGDMACIHNCLLRGLNSIYLQAPYVAPAEHRAFANYAFNWAELVRIHHGGEEAHIFPVIEKIVGEPGAMQGNVDQHAAFHDGLEQYTAYTADCAAGRTPFDGAHLVELIDSFAPALVQHLRDEVPTLDSLRRFDGKPGVDKLKGAILTEAGKSMKSCGPVTSSVWLIVNLDVNFEGGRWTQFPPAPGFLLFLIRHVFYWVHTSWWKFAPCDRHGTMRPLYAVPSE
ncbi:hemerythrin HHE cation binding domain-containing protein [Niveomyces insectorum RCEF 264]|uniref:Hemerythrin HHE cation binding domain-containing protein n=1 Tax=Niveomyces insectorum RCEF 264 TaxID=1081102 RepID=A0A167ST62_9HYPO|nr:hemerythrin HHE cation binding domain-containing protein [Niveomyces insectorum RCEF 264]